MHQFQSFHLLGCEQHHTSTVERDKASMHLHKSATHSAQDSNDSIRVSVKFFNFYDFHSSNVNIVLVKFMVQVVETRNKL